jgi:GNAT superfamily N-acetyltransferase
MISGLNGLSSSVWNACFEKLSYTQVMIVIREVCVGDVAAICGHRRRMFEEAGVAAATLDRMGEAFPPWLRARIEDGSYFGFIAEDANDVVGGIGLRLIDWPPSPWHPTVDKRGYILNLYVEPVYRGRGVAKAMMARAEERFRELGVTYEILHATVMGRPLYEKLGWVATTEMGKHL